MSGKFTRKAIIANKITKLEERKIETIYDERQINISRQKKN